MSSPFFLPSYKYIDKTIKEKQEAAQKKAAFQANRNREEPKKKQKKGLLSKALSTASGLDDVLGEAADVVGTGKDISAKAFKGAVKGLETWGNQVQSVPAAAFTKGVVEDGQYTTERNLIGNPFANVQSHVKAQREVGLLGNERPSNVFDALKQGFTAANRAGQAYSEDPDIAPGVKFATGVAFDPTTYIGAGALSKAAGVSATPALKGKFLRGALGLAEGFDKPSQIAKFTIGGAIGTQVAANKDIPFVSEGVEQFAGGLLGGGIGLGVGKRGVGKVLKEDMPNTLAKVQGRTPEQGPMIGAGIEFFDDPKMQALRKLSMDADPEVASKAEAEIARLAEQHSTGMTEEVTKRIPRSAKLDELTTDELLQQGDVAHQYFSEELDKQIDLEYNGFDNPEGKLVDPERMAGDAVNNVEMEHLRRATKDFADKNSPALGYKVTFTPGFSDGTYMPDLKAWDNKNYKWKIVSHGGIFTPEEIADNVNLLAFGREIPVSAQDTNIFDYDNIEEMSNLFIGKDTSSLEKFFVVNDDADYMKYKNSVEARQQAEGNKSFFDTNPKLRFRGDDAPFIGGGAAPEQLVQPKPVTPGLTKAEQVGNTFTELKKFITGKGIKNEAQATPIAKEALRINSILSNQGNTLARLSQRAERLFNVDEAGVSQDLGATLQDIARNYSTYADRLNPDQVKIMESLRFNMDAYEELHRQFGLSFGKLDAGQRATLRNVSAGQATFPGFAINEGGLVFDDPQGFYLPRGLTNYLGEETLPELRPSSRLQGTPGYTRPQAFDTMAEGIRYGYEYPKLSEAIESYGNSVADRASKSWMDQEVEKLARNLPGQRRTTGTYVTAGNEAISLPPEISDVLNRAIDTMHGHKSSEAAQAFTAINNVLRRMWAAGDASFVGIQNLLVAVDNPKLAAKNAKLAFTTLKDPTVFGKFVEAHDRAAMGTGSPSVARWVKSNLHISDVEASGTDLAKRGGGDLAERIERVKFYGGFLKHSGRLFSDSGNFNRVGLADLLYDQWKTGGKIPGLRITSGMDEDTVLEMIANAANRSTGYSPKTFGGGFGSALFFAPRFMASQFETLSKAATDTGIEGQVARRQLVKLVAIGSAITVVANEVRGKDTEFNPLNSNFMRIRDVFGNDVSLFGPWDTLVRGLIKSAPHQNDQGDWEFTGGLDFLRSKLSPVLSTTADIAFGENVVGEKTRGPQALKNTLLPFGLRKIGQENPLKTGLGLLGVKANPLTSSENLDRILANANIKKSDPDYLIKRRDYLAKNPGDIPESKSAEFKRGQEVRGDISSRRKLNDEMAQAGDLTLVEFRENRKLLLTEQRNRLDEILPDFKPGDSKQDKWLSSYFKLFDDKSVQDPITGELNGDKFDELVAKWTNDNGQPALDFVQRYLGSGLSPVESAYYNDLRKLSATGYFDLPKYQRMASGLDDDTIDSLVAQVDAYRAGAPSNIPWAKSAQILLGDSLDQTELMDIIHSRSDAYQNPERAALKKQYAKELLWFNPRANWNSYVDYKPSTGQSGSSSGFKLTLPKLQVKLPKLTINNQ